MRHLKTQTKVYRYTIRKKLSAGGFGIVYLANRDDGLLVAIKEYMPAYIKNRDKDLNIKFPSAKEQKLFEKGANSFYQEAETISKIYSPNIVSILDVFPANNTVYFVMPFEPGDTLQFLNKKHKSYLNYNKIKDYFIDIAHGIGDLHQHGLLHLDIKPSNVMIRPDETVLIIDLGTSKTKAQLLDVGINARTVGFTAPEQHGKKNYRLISQQTDIYGICASLLCILIGKSPKISTKRKNDKPFIQQYAGQFPYELLSIIDKGMALNPLERYQNIEELKEALSQITITDREFWNPSIQFKIKKEDVNLI